MSKKSRRRPKREEQIERMKATFRMVDVMPLLGALSISLSDGNYKRGYDSCESLLQVIYDIKLKCILMENIYK